MKGVKKTIQGVQTWLHRQALIIKTFFAVIFAITSLMFIHMIVHDHDNLFIVGGVVHSLGICILIYKLSTGKTCSGLSLKSQELTALYLTVRVYCSFVMDYDVNTLLDFAAFVTTIWVIYMIRFKLKSSYIHYKDTFPHYYVVIPCALLSVVVHPSRDPSHIINRILWAFSVYLEAVSVLPQLLIMQKTKIVEAFTAHYVFALGVVRFLSCADWILRMIDTRGQLLTVLAYGLWPSMVLFSEIVQTFILADFCYYYLRSVVDGQPVLLPSEDV